LVDIVARHLDYEVAFVVVAPGHCA
jgi:hypothetical protein